MKKISLKNLNVREVEQLSREQLKGVLGGTAGTRKVMCCPESVASGIGCSSCVEVGVNSTARCDMGILVSC